MRILLFAIFGVLVTQVDAQEQEFNPFEGPKPIITFIQSNPWANVIGADTPRVAIYENGEVIFVKEVEERHVYHRAQLDADALANVRQRLQPVIQLRDLKTLYNLAPNMTDQPTAMFYLRDGGREAAATVYGLSESGAPQLPFTQLPGDAREVQAPAELLELHEWLCEIDFPESEEWTPKYVEVMLWDYSYAPDPSIDWPREWPSLQSERAMRRGDSYSVFLDGDQLENVRAFLATRKPRGAVEVDQRKWAAAYRFAFPSESMWRNAFFRVSEVVGEGDEHKNGKVAAD
jgi:hypothetical protein